MMEDCKLLDKKGFCLNTVLFFVYSVLSMVPYTVSGL